MDSFHFCLSETAVPKPRCGTWPRSHQCQAELNNNTRVCCAVLLLLNFRIKRFFPGTGSVLPAHRGYGLLQARLRPYHPAAYPGTSRSGSHALVFPVKCGTFGWFWPNFTLWNLGSVPWSRSPEIPPCSWGQRSPPRLVLGPRFDSLTGAVLG